MIVLKYYIFILCCVSILSCTRETSPSLPPETPSGGRAGTGESSPTAISSHTPPLVPTNTHDLATEPQVSNGSSSETNPALDPLQVASGNIQDIWWSDDSDTLFYGVPYKNFFYHIEQEITQDLSLEELHKQTPEPQILSYLPLEARRIYVSPSGNSALYFKIVEASLTPTPSETAELGEYTSRGMMAELWFQEKDDYASKIGDLEFCGFTDAFWTNDELKAVITRSPGIGLCGETYAWLVDISHETLHPLFPVEEYPVAVRTYDISPDGNNLLFGTFGIYEDDLLTNPLYLLNLENITVEQLDTPTLAHGEQWLTDHKLLISYRKQSHTGLTLGLFDLETSELIELTPMFNGLCIRFSSISPDIEWLAFATGQNCDFMENLWLMKLTLDE